MSSTDLTQIQAAGVSERGYSQIIVAPVDFDGALAFVSGQVALDESGAVVGEGDFVQQCRFVFEQMRRRLEEVGSSLDRVLKLTAFVRNFDDYSKLVDFRRQYFSPAHPPASTAVAVSALVDPRLLIEIEAVALVPRSSDKGRRR